MATPSAVLSVLVSADTADATAKLSKFDRQIAATTDVARKGIDAQLGGTFNGEAFTRYQEAVGKASRVAKDRAPRSKPSSAPTTTTRDSPPTSGKAGHRRREADREAQGHAGQDQGQHQEKSGELRGRRCPQVREARGGGRRRIAVAYEAIGKARDAIESTLTLGEATERLTAATSLDTQAGVDVDRDREGPQHLSDAGQRAGSRRSTKQIRSASEGSRRPSKKAFDELGVSQRRRWRAATPRRSSTTSRRA